MSELTLEGVDAQFCSDWLKDQIRTLIKENTRYRKALELIKSGDAEDWVRHSARMTAQEALEHE